jgi:lipopolysaccharide export system protein LptA
MKMRRGPAARLAAFLLLLMGLWALTRRLETQRVVIREESAADHPDARTSEILQVQIFDTEGQPLDSVSARKGKQNQEEQLQLSDVEAKIHAPGGSLIHFNADHYEDDKGRRTLRSNPGSRISLQEQGGLALNTEGPVTMDEAGVIQSKVQTQFSWREWRGSAAGVRYEPARILCLEGTAKWEIEGGQSIEGQNLILDMQQGVGQMERAILRQTGEPHIVLEAPHMLLFLAHGSPRLDSVLLIGPKSSLSWPSGVLRSSRLSVCLDQEGNFASAETHPNVSLSFRTTDGATLQGTTGPIQLSCQHGALAALTCSGAVKLKGNIGDAPFLLECAEGMTTSFDQGVAVDTVLSGAANFAFQQLSGQSGRIRLLHRENRLLLSENALLYEAGEGMQLWGEEILIAHWTQPNREIYGRGFVKLRADNAGSGSIEATGESLSLVFPERWMILKGRPARFEQGERSIEALEVRVVPGKTAGHDLFAEGDLHFRLRKGGEEWMLKGKSMEIHQQEGTLRVRDVQEARLQPMGQLSASEVVLDSDQEGTLRSLLAEGNVLFSGSLPGEGKGRSYSGRADRLHFLARTNEIELLGHTRDVLLLSDDGNEVRGRSLTYNLSDGSLRSGSDPRSFGHLLYVPRETPHE